MISLSCETDEVSSDPKPQEVTMGIRQSITAARRWAAYHERCGHVQQARAYHRAAEQLMYLLTKVRA